ncbi:DUF3108 domain-containing protein [Janthinobacterium agaricidamnosum]|uniref:DUF3108 domain-containing protein n=1 Tax=Janthinobacterium agaricidamnosum NBRC 102515 = DSM 9628 TaxID=1349767 RepID=W0VDK8_9BURK|nr:DUF3108 domain-containing protein [Janthinobacterium agaricidamnosum]CDG85392.1 putative uncharacterized protein [Janthinobacterium agaricidamnosum NBRC 102515 = DSM 9628]
MLNNMLKHTLAGGLLLATLAPVFAADKDKVAPVDHPSIKRPYKLPPSADLSYKIQARQRGISLNGEAVTVWQTGDGKYALHTDTKVPLFGKILEHNSEGTIDDYGIAPGQFVEKRFRKDPSTTTFKRDTKTIVFGDSDESYPIKGGEQDRSTAAWQLLAIARGAPEKFVPGSQWALFVAGRRDADPWIFKVVNQETVSTGQGDVSALHLVKTPPPDAKGQAVDLWLAPSLDWYPVKVKFADDDGDYVEQTLDKITKK